MIKFTLTLNGSEMSVFGESLEKAWNGKIPEEWSDNKDKITEEDITEEANYILGNKEAREFLVKADEKVLSQKISDLAINKALLLGDFRDAAKELKGN